MKFCSISCSKKQMWVEWKWKTQFKVGMVAPNKGKVYTEEQKKWMKLFEKWHTKVWTEHLKKWRENGWVAWNKWIYGYHIHWWNKKTRTNKAIRQSQKYLNWRNEIYKRDDYTCKICGDRWWKLHVDHIKQFALIIRQNGIDTVDKAFECGDLWDKTNWRTLCIECHKKTESYQKPLKI